MKLKLAVKDLEAEIKYNEKEIKRAVRQRDFEEAARLAVMSEAIEFVIARLLFVDSI